MYDHAVRSSLFHKSFSRTVFCWENSTEECCFRKIVLITFPIKSVSGQKFFRKNMVPKNRLHTNLFLTKSISDQKWFKENIVQTKSFSVKIRYP